MSGASKLTKSEIATALREIASLLQFRDENQFKVRAFENAARSLAADSTPLEELVRPGGGLEKIKGIGKATADVIRQLALTGKADMLDDLRDGAPTGLAGLLRIPKLGAKKIGILHAELGINTLEDLEVACRDGRVATCRGFTKKAAETILAGIEQAQRFSGQLMLSQAEILAGAILEQLRNCPEVIRAEVAGSLRRKKEVVGDIDFVASSDDADSVMQCFSNLPYVTSVIGSGQTKTSVLMADDVQADLRVVPDDQFATALHHFTGSKEHNTQLRSRALKLGLKINEYGVFKTGKTGDTPMPVKNETELFKALNLDYIAPELREGQGEIEAAEAGKLPRIIEPGDYLGVLHCHTDWSDGKNTVMEMAAAARDDRGWQYFAVCDHSQLAAYAGGLKPAQLPDQHAEIDEANAALASNRFQVLKGCECDILRDGEMDYSDSVLATMDIVVASVHTRYALDGPGMTARIIRAMENPYVNIIGHVTGRLLLSREPYDVDMEAILQAAARTRTVMEINADPRRLDIDWRYCKRAKELGVMFSINPDAHSIAGLRAVRYGISMARKGWLTPEEIINCMPLLDFLKWTKAQRAFKLERAAENWSE